MAKEVLMESIDIHELKARGPQNRIEELRLELFEKVNQLGIGAQGLGGLTTVLDVKIMDYPTHAASLPVCMIPNCAATRHAHSCWTAPARPSWKRRRWTPTRNRLGSRPERPPRQPRRDHPGRSRQLEAGRDPAAQRQDAHRS